jgi:hypothetical protein
MGLGEHGAFQPRGCAARCIQPRAANDLWRRRTGSGEGSRRWVPEAVHFDERRRTLKEPKNWGKMAGLVLHILIGGLMIFTGSQKVLGLIPPEALAKYGLGEQVRLIGAGAILTGLLLLIPRT